MLLARHCYVSLSKQIHINIQTIICVNPILSVFFSFKIKLTIILHMCGYSATFQYIYKVCTYQIKEIYISPFWTLLHAWTLGASLFCLLITIS